MVLWEWMDVGSLGFWNKMAIIDLNDLKGIPKDYIEELQTFNVLFKENVFLEDLLSNYSINNLVERINEFCLKNQIFGYHYTRAIPDELIRTGLTCRKGDDIREAFIANFGNQFTEDEKLKIKEKWNNHFEFQKKNRDNRLFFNFTTIELENYGAEPLLSNYGGEQVYLPLCDLPGIGEKIKCIGTPLILKCKLDPNNINTFHERTWGRIAVSSYHCQLNNEAIQFDQDGYQYNNVKPENIEIIEYDEEVHYR